MGEALLKSMTGYGRSSLTVPAGRLEVEIQGVNRRHLEMSLSLPKQFLPFEGSIRKWVAELVARGQINLSLLWKPHGKDGVQIDVDLGLARALKEGWEKVAKELGVKGEVTLEMLSQEDILIPEKKVGESIEKELQTCVERALELFDEAKRAEGRALGKDFVSRISLLGKLIAKIEGHAQDAVRKTREKLSQRLNDLFSTHVENEEKVLKEVALFAEKIDITEEIVRFKSHLQTFDDVLKKPLLGVESAKGKRLEFLLQELHREMNTIGSKSADTVVSQTVVDAKCELEKMRESVQNIE